MTDNMMPELTLEPTAAAEAVPQLTLESPPGAYGSRSAGAGGEEDRAGGDG